MTAALVCIPLLSAFAGWMTIRLAIYFLFQPKKPIDLFNFRFQGAYNKKEKRLKAAIAALIKKELTESEKSTVVLAAPENIGKLRPELEQHVDVFLKIKLKEAMPMIGMLIGDRTINQLKSLFMQELETLFPSVMNSYVKHIINDEGVDRLIEARLDAFDAEGVKHLLFENASQELRNLQWLAVIIGLIIGGLQLLIIIFLLP
jgi:uncharacterized membrane protein YheB (UPF0754 family)